MVTVIIPAYKREDDLRQALQSLVIQTSKDFKVLVSDDCSPKSLRSVCMEFKNQLDITYIRTPENRGCGGNRQFALQWFLTEISTDYVMFLDSDDVLMPQAIARLNVAIEKNKADLISTDIVEETLAPEQQVIPADKSKTWLHGKIYRTQFLRKHHIQFNTTLRTNEDLAFNLTVYAYEPESYFLPEQLYLWRTNQESITRHKGNDAVLQKCNSIDYIMAIYDAYTHYPEGKLTTLMIGNILNCYNFWQRGEIYGTLTDQVEACVNEMLHNLQVIKTLVMVYDYPDTTFKIDAWCIFGTSLVFFRETIGAWIMHFFTKEEIRSYIEQFNKK